MAVISAFNEGTAKNIQLDAGIIFFDVASDAKALLDNGAFDITSYISSGATKKIGATKGGATFSAVPEIRNLLDGFNGVRGNYKGSDIIDSWEVSLKTTVSELTLKNLEMAANTTATDVRSGQNYDKKITSKIGIIASTYYKDVIWCGRLAGKQQPIVIYLSNVLNSNGVNIVAADKDTGSVEVEFKAHFTLCDDTVPYAIYYPKN